MTTPDALRYFAHLQWTMGNNKLGCFCPSDYMEDLGYAASQKNYGLASDALIEEYDATHYSREWQEQGKSVKIILYTAEAFGAARDLKPITELIIEVDNESKVPV